MFLKVLLLIRQLHQNNVLFVTICIFLNKGFKFQSSVFNFCHVIVIMSIDLISISILNIYQGLKQI